jgi:hypothetical protein
MANLSTGRSVIHAIAVIADGKPIRREGTMSIQASQ